MAGPQQADEVLEVGLLAAVVLGIVEGLTEFLPVSSTGHLIVAGKLLGVHNSTLEVGIQVGAITAILVLYGSRLVDALRRFLARDRSQPNLLLQLVLAALPAALLGLLLDRNPLGRAVVYRQARATVRKKTGGHYPAPLEAIEAVRAGLERGMTTGLRWNAKGSAGSRHPRWRAS